MPVPTPELIEEIIEFDDAPCVSLFMPTHRAGPEIRQGPIRMKNLLGTALARLEERGMRRPDAEEVLAPARRLLGDEDFWQHRDLGLAVFLAPGFERIADLDVPVDERVEVANRFAITPLIPALDLHRRFFVLALSLQHVRLIEGTLHHAEELDLADLPSGLDDVLWYLDREPQMQHHESGSTMFHGQGGPEEPTDEDMATFLRAVADRIRTVIGERRAPVVVAAVDRLQTAFRSVADDLEVLGTGIDGNPEHRSSRDLHAEAIELVRPIFDAPRENEAARFAALAGTGTTSTDPDRVLEAAINGRVGTLFVPTGAGADLDAVVAAAWKTGAQIFSVDSDAIPGDGPVAAIYRW